MRLLIESAILFFGTLMAAALFALGMELVAALEVPEAAPQAGPSSQSRPVQATPGVRPGR